MTLLLYFSLAMVVIGMVTQRLDARTYALVIACVLGVTFLYYFTHRFMT